MAAIDHRFCQQCPVCSDQPLLWRRMPRRHRRWPAQQVLHRKQGKAWTWPVTWVHQRRRRRRKFVNVSRSNPNSLHFSGLLGCGKVIDEASMRISIHEDNTEWISLPFGNVDYRVSTDTTRDLKQMWKCYWGYRLDDYRHTNIISPSFNASSCLWKRRMKCTNWPVFLHAWAN